MSDVPRVAVVGSINMDLSVATERVPLRGENLRARKLTVGLGGKGASPAVALAQLGAASTLVACVGDDEFGQRALETLQLRGVDGSAVQVLAHRGTGVALIMVDDAGENTILVVIGANQELHAERVQQGLDGMAAHPEALLVNFEVPADAVTATIAWGRAHAIPVVVDAGPIRDYGPDIWAQADVLSPNASETAHLTGLAVDGLASARLAAERLKVLGPRAVALKLGAQGCLLLDDDGARQLPAYQVQVADTTGAGDAWSAGLTLGLARGLSLDDAAQLANVCGAVAVSRVGAVVSMPTAQDVARLRAEQPEPPLVWL